MHSDVIRCHLSMLSRSRMLALERPEALRHRPTTYGLSNDFLSRFASYAALRSASQTAGLGAAASGLGSCARVSEIDERVPRLVAGGGGVD